MASTSLDRFTGSDEEFLEGNEAPKTLVCPFCLGERIRWEPKRITSNGKTVYDSFTCGACNGTGEISS